MTKMKHTRPSLRYIDNVRRELLRENRPAPNWFEPEKLKALGVRIKEQEALPQYIEEFGNLPQSQQEIAGWAINAYSTYMDANLEVLELFMKGGSKARKLAKTNQEIAYENLVTASAVLAGSIIDDFAENRPGFREWYQDFFSALDRQAQSGWEGFSEIILEEGLPLYFAQEMADSPDDIPRLKHLFTAEDWQ